MRPLLSLCAPADWRAALDAGVLDPAVAPVTPWSPEQPQRSPAGHRDLLLLVVDPTRLESGPGEAGLPPEPLPVRAVTAVVPYRPPVPPRWPAPDDALGRAWNLTASFAVRRAARVRDVPGGVAVTDPRVPHAHEHNRLVLDSPADAATVAAAAAGLPTPTAVLLGPDAATVAAGLASRGWTAVELVVMARSPAAPLPGGDRAEVVSVGDAAAFREAGWRRDLPADLPDREEVVAQLVGREALLEPVAAVSEVVVREDGRVVAAGQLRVDGATAGLEAVATEPAARGRGHGDAVLARALAEAGAAGCDLVVLEAVTDDWPRHWYARRGFAVVGSTWEATAPQAGGATQDSSR